MLFLLWGSTATVGSSKKISLLMGDAAGDIQAAEQAPAEPLGQKPPVILQAHELNGLLYQPLPLALVV